MTFKHWIPTFLAFPLGGLLAIETVGSLHDPVSAAAGGLVAGAVIGAGQWLALRSRGIGRRWVAYTAAAMAGGSALAAAVTGAGTGLADVMVAGLVTGAAVGAAQSTLLARGRRLSATWTAVNAAGWSLGWLAAWVTLVDIERGYYVFGAGGALLVTVLTGLTLRRAFATTSAARPAAGYAVLTPGWPDDPETVEEARAQPELFARKTIEQVADRYAEVIGRLTRKAGGHRAFLRRAANHDPRRTGTRISARLRRDDLPGGDGEPQSRDQGEGRQQESRPWAAAHHLRRRRSHRAPVDRERRVQEATPQRRRDRDRQGFRPEALTHNRQRLARGRGYGASVR
jgi:hypothetical protein